MDPETQNAVSLALSTIDGLPHYMHHLLVAIALSIGALAIGRVRLLFPLTFLTAILIRDLQKGGWHFTIFENLVVLGLILACAALGRPKASPLFTGAIFYFARELRDAQNNGYMSWDDMLWPVIPLTLLGVWDSWRRSR